MSYAHRHSSTAWNPQKICGLNKPISACGALGKLHSYSFIFKRKYDMTGLAILRECFCKRFRDRGGRQMGRLNCRVQTKISRHNVALKRGTTLNWQWDGILIDFFSAPLLTPPSSHNFPNHCTKTYSKHVYLLERSLFRSIMKSGCSGRTAWHSCLSPESEIQ